MEFDEEQDEMSSPMQGGGEEEDVGARKDVEVGGAVSRTTSYRYKECLKNHAVGIGGHAVDGCGEFMAGGEEGTLDALKCAACNCHRNFHRKETEGGGEEQRFPLPHHHHHRHFSPSPYSFRSPHPSGYLHVTPNHNYNNNNQRQLALPSTSRGGGGGEDQELEDVSNPSSSGGGGGTKKRRRFRTKFTQEQKEKMFGFAERLGWRIQKQDEGMVQQFCAETNVKRHVLKVWMHNNKHTLSKSKP